MLTRTLLRPLRTTAVPALAGRPLRAARAYTDKAEDPNAKENGTDEPAASPSAAQIAELEAKIKETTKDLQYLRADYQTLARRGAEEKRKASDYAISAFARDLLDTVMMLDEALEGVAPPAEGEENTPQGNLYRGVELTRKDLLKTFEMAGVVPMENPIGKPFDPNFMEAAETVPVAEAPKHADGSEAKPGEVFEQGQPGWLIRGRVLRPAQVGVVAME